MANTMKPTIETGAMTLVLLVKNYKSQMVALLLKNGVTVPSDASDQQIAMLMVNLLKISKSFSKDLNDFLKNPKVIEVLAGGMMQSGQYLRASGFAGKKQGNAQYFRADGDTSNLDSMMTEVDNLNNTPSTTTATTTTPPKSGGFWSNLNFGNLFSQAVNAFGQYNTNQANVAIANAHAQVGSNVGSDTGSDINNTGGGKTPAKVGMSTTTIVVLSLLGVALLGTVIYFVTKPKK